jgi:predicted RNase H-like nuclease (RuvC/YqgF family)
VPDERIERRQVQQPPRPAPEPQPERERSAKIPAFTQAIEQVNEIIEELKHALDEMEDVLETLELAERQKIDDEREIDELKRALRRLHRPRDDTQRHQ